MNTVCRFLVVGAACLIFPFSLLAAAGPGSFLIKHFEASGDGLQKVIQSERDLPVVGEADVVVAGGGVAGVAAALKAAEEGYSVILLEERNYFGYEFTATGRSRTSAAFRDPESPWVRAMLEELRQNRILASASAGAVNEAAGRTSETDGAESENTGLSGETDTASQITIDPEALRLFLHRKVSSHPNIAVYFYSMATGVLKRDNRVCGVVFSGRDGRQVLLAQQVVDATDHARLARASGAEMMHIMQGENRVRRFISVRLPGNVPRGAFHPRTAGFTDEMDIWIHERHMEISLPVNIGRQTARELSRIHSETLKLSFELRDYLNREGWLPLDVISDFRSAFVPAPETWMDRVPVVFTRGPVTRQEVRQGDFSRIDAVSLPGIEGLMVAGRTVLSDPEFSELAVLLAVGELAGTSVGSMVHKDPVSFTGLMAESSESAEYAGPGLQVAEILAGIEKKQSYPRVRQEASELPVMQAYDVLIVGGGTSGALAAISAAREGARVAVVEILPNLGGIGSNRVQTYYWGAPWKSLLRQELGDGIQLSKRGGSGPLEKVDFSGEDKKWMLQHMALQSGVDIYFQSLGAGAVTEGNRVRGVVVENQSGRHVLLSDVVIDATGHAGIAVAAGAGYAFGRETDGFIHETSHLSLRDPTHVADISASYRQIPSTAISLSIRESRRVTGDYVVTFKDQIAGREFEDVISRWYSNYDTHFPNSANQSDLAQDWTAILGLWRRPILGSIPYRSILPQGLDQILVAAMAYSADHDALIGGRMQPDMEHLGEAAGVAAAMASRMGVTVREIPVDELQDRLVRRGVLRQQDVPHREAEGALSAEQLHRQDFWREERERHFPPRPDRTLREWSEMLGTDLALEAMLELYLAGESSIPLLRPLLETDQTAIREEAAVVLGMLGDRSSIAALLEFLEERNTRRFEFTLPLATSRPSVPLYWTSVILLGRFEEQRAVPAMTGLLEQPPPPEEFGKLTREAYGTDMFRSTEECPPPLASFLMVSLGRIADPEAIPAILPYVSVVHDVEMNRENRDFEISWGVQTNAAWALSQMGDWSGVPELIRLLDSDQALLRRYAAHLLESITGMSRGLNAADWQHWWEEHSGR